MSGYITERDMLAIMETGKPFSVSCVSFDRKKDTGGEVREYPEAILVQSTKEASANARRALTRAEAQAIEARNPKASKNPQHRSWYTRNIRLLQDGHPTSLQRKIHPPLVLTFNGKRVVP